MKDKIKKRTRLNKGARTYLASTQKAFSHPVRRDILKTLKKGTCSSVDLEEIIGTTRYNLYYHLEVLIKEDLISQSGSKKKKKSYSIKTSKKSNSKVFILSDEEISKNPKAWKRVLDGLEAIENVDILNKDKITNAEIHIKYK